MTAPAEYVCRQNKSTNMSQLVKHLAMISPIIKKSKSEISKIIKENIDEKLPCVVYAKQIKAFYNLLDTVGKDSEKDHPLCNNLKSSLKDRLTVAGTILSLKKVIKLDCECLKQATSRSFIKLLSSKSPVVLNSQLKQHIKRVVNKYFHVGFDKEYRSNCMKFTPSDKSTSEDNVDDYWAGRRDEYEDLTMTNNAFLNYTNSNPVVKQTIISDGGKLRSITKNAPLHQILHPLHKTIYDQLSKFECILRGPPNSEILCDRLGALHCKEKYYSVDYTNATDNLSQEVASYTLDCILKKCSYVPDSVAFFAKRSIYNTIEMEEFSFKQRRGQLMGNLLSFPLLCLQNIIATTYKTGICKFIINGDDLVFRATEKKAALFFSNVKKIGLETSPGKCFVSKKFLAINSSYFWVKKYAVYEQLNTLKLKKERIERLEKGQDLVARLIHPAHIHEYNQFISEKVNGNDSWIPFPKNFRLVDCDIGEKDDLEVSLRSKMVDLRWGLKKTENTSKKEELGKKNAASSSLLTQIRVAMAKSIKAKPSLYKGLQLTKVPLLIQETSRAYIPLQLEPIVKGQADKLVNSIYSPAEQFSRMFAVSNQQ